LKKSLFLSSQINGQKIEVLPKASFLQQNLLFHISL
jgi:hypothetical protein